MKNKLLLNTALVRLRRLVCTIGVWVFGALLAACGGGAGGNDEGPGTAPENPAPPSPSPGAKWTPAVTDTWQWQINGAVATGYDVTVYDIDLFDNSAAAIAALKAQGRRVVCYFSAGSYEAFRADAGRFAAADLGTPLDPPFAEERWLDTRSANVREIMKSRLDLAVSRGCDGVEPDNMDGYTNSPGFALDRDTQLDFNRFIADEAHTRGLAVGLKNDTDQLSELEPWYDFAVNEQCHEFAECASYSVFTAKGKPVFNAEYAAQWAADATQRAALCAAARAANLRTLVLPLALDNSLRFSCD
jgi:endo-alpha-1,4-polygalactosaminidase (GH114 family)